MRDVKYMDAGPNEYRYKHESVWTSAIYLVLLAATCLYFVSSPGIAYLAAAGVGAACIMISGIVRSTVSTEQTIKNAPSVIFLYGVIWPFTALLALLNVVGNKRYFPAPGQ